MSDINEKMLSRLQQMEREVERLRVQENGKFVALTTPLTSTSWDGDSFSTTSKTLIDLSTVFGAPAGIKAVLVQLICKDSGSAASNDIYFGVSPNNSSGSVTVISVGRGLPNDTLVYSQGICP